MSDTFRFDKETHEYWLDDLRLPSVTEIISPLAEYYKIPKSLLEYKQDLGGKFHDAINLYLYDNLDEESLDKALVNPIRGFKEWWAQRNVNSLPKERLIIEIPKYHSSLRYAGTPDLIITETYQVYDWKLRPFSDILDPLQLSAYHGLTRVGGATKDKQWVVSFDKEGNYKEHNAYRKNAWGVFRKLLEHYWQEQKFQKIMKGWKGK